MKLDADVKFISELVKRNVQKQLTGTF